MNTRIPYAIITAFNIILFVLVIVNLLLFQKLDIPIIGMLYIMILSMTIRLLKHNLALGTILITLYIQVVGPLEMLLIRLVPFDILGNYFIQYVDVMEDMTAYWLYFVYSALTYVFIIVSHTFVYKHGCRIRTYGFFKDIGIGGTLLQGRMSSLFFLSLYAAVTYVVRVKYNLNIPGKRPTLPHAGVIVYTCQAVGTLMLYKAFQNAFTGKKLYIRNYLYSIFCCIIFAFPSILLDQRGPLFQMLIILALYTYVLDTNRFMVFAKKNCMFIATSVAMFFSLYQFITTSIRYQGKMQVSILYILSRLVGIGPGLIFINYISNNGIALYTKFGIFDYIDNAIGSRSNSLNKVFTHEVLGFPQEMMHLAAVPTFVGTLLYHGMVGVIFFAVMIGIILAVCDIFQRKSFTNYGKFMSVYLIVNTLFIMMGGVEEIVELFAVPCIMIVLRLLYDSNFALKKEAK